MLAAAAGIRKVIDSQMADLIRKSTLERGYDPRDFVLVAYGGAGPVHAASYAAEAGVREIIVPFFATVHSAYGAALSDVRFSLQHSHPLVPPVAPQVGRGHLRGDGGRGCAQARPMPTCRPSSGASSAGSRRATAARCTTCACRRRRASTTQGLQLMLDRFEAEYERLFGKGAALKDAGIELVNYGVDAVGAVDKAVLAPWPTGDKVAPRTHRMTWCPRTGGMVPTPIFDGPALPAGMRIAGPAIIEHPGTTIVVLAGQSREHRRPAPYAHQHRPSERRMNRRIDADVDPVTFEVLNHRLLSITEEMGIQYMRCSGSNVLITGNDAATAIMMPDGALVVGRPLHRHAGQRAAADRREHATADARATRASTTATSSSATTRISARSTIRTSRR